MPALGELELEILEHLWSRGESDVAETHAHTGKKRKISPNTVGSALERLFRKDLISRRKVSHAFRYSPRVSRDEFVARRAADAAGGLEALARVGVLSAFVDMVSGVDAAALDRLEALITAKKDERGGK